ncbi:MAG: autotransporter-associated beta strand repeat-containing protein [Verrucomicrobiae bacterium]|nr:autotransporter-associated beta strand repeat-containing protein [Verrucomicrobiae bacterium]MDW8308415.1 PEP-CTERM sorting domain-containing protein [Verrucomicrobiales bacterium]
MRRHFGCIGLGLLLIAGAVHGQVSNVWWDPGATASTNGGGAGTWNFTTNQWFNGTSMMAWTNHGNLRAIFGGPSGGTVTIASGLIVFADSLVFNTPGYNIAGGGVRRVTLSSGVIEANADATITTAITNPTVGPLVGIIKTGLGRLTFAMSNNFFLGGLTVSGGSLVLLDKDQIGAAGGSVTVNGGALELLGVQSVSARTLWLGDNGGTLHLPGAADQWSFNDVRGTNGTLTKTGPGTLIIFGPGTNGASRVGGTVVNGGELRINTTTAPGLGIGPLTVNAGGTLAGSGLVGGPVTVHGTIAPGAGGVGTLTLQDDLSFSSGAQLTFELNQPGVVGGGVNDWINVAGDLVLDGTLNIVGLANFGLGTYTLITYGGTLTDNGLTIGNLSGNATPAFHYQIQAGSGTVNLLVVPEPGTLTLGALGALAGMWMRRRARF